MIRVTVWNEGIAERELPNGGAKSAKRSGASIRTAFTRRSRKVWVKAASAGFPAARCSAAGARGGAGAARCFIFSPAARRTRRIMTQMYVACCAMRCGGRRRRGERGKTGDPYGGDFLEQLAKCQQNVRNRRLSKIAQVLQVAVFAAERTETRTGSYGWLTDQEIASCGPIWFVRIGLIKVLPIGAGSMSL